MPRVLSLVIAMCKTAEKRNQTTPPAASQKALTASFSYLDLEEERHEKGKKKHSLTAPLSLSPPGPPGKGTCQEDTEKFPPLFSNFSLGRAGPAGSGTPLLPLEWTGGCWAGGRRGGGGFGWSSGTGAGAPAALVLKESLHRGGEGERSHGAAPRMGRLSAAPGRVPS